MRVAIANRYLRMVGGVESYLNCVIPELARAGHQVAFLYENDGDERYAQVSVPQGAPVWRLTQAAHTDAIAALKDWRPDVVFVHGTAGENEAKLIELAPAVFFAHAYSGTCVGGEKAFKFPFARPCARRFGWQCLAYYYPRRCGGLNPRTMMTEYVRQAARLDMLRHYDAIVTASEHMRAEYIRHGFTRVYKVGLPLAERAHCAPPSRAVDYATDRDGEKCNRGFHLLFSGRMMPLKGGVMLLDALPRAAAALDRPMRLTLAGDGPARKAWQAKAREIEARHGSIEINFSGWMAHNELAARYRDVDLIVMPSLWPEPFGLAGPEAGLFGIPAAAYAVGGIPEWLHDGVNGHLAPADPPTAAGLADVIAACLRDRSHYQLLREGARIASLRMTISNHLGSLLEVFSEVRKKIKGSQPDGWQPNDFAKAR
ncbi:MAG: glycosyltransferase family 4 protein [Candidatus Binataceae bacterium]